MRALTVFCQLNKELFLPFVKLANMRIRETQIFIFLSLRLLEGQVFYIDYLEEPGASENLNNNMGYKNYLGYSDRDMVGD